MFEHLILAVLALGLCIGPATCGAASDGAQPVLQEAEALKVSQAAVGRTVGDHAFVDARGKPARLSDYRGKPLVVNLVYTSCYHTCPMLTRHLASVVDVAREALGAASFSVVTIGFDARVDTPARMRSFARARGIDEPGWKFLSADPQTIAALVQDLGFVYFPSPKGFDHLAQTTVVDAHGRVYRQVYGETFDPPSLVEPLKELVLGIEAAPATLQGWINSVRLFCTIYDPSTGAYRFDYSLFIGAGIGVLCLGGVGWFIVKAWRDQRHTGRAA